VIVSDVGVSLRNWEVPEEYSAEGDEDCYLDVFWWMEVGDYFVEGHGD